MPARPFRGFQHVCYQPKLLSAHELDCAVREAWREFYTLPSIARRLYGGRAPVNRGNLVLWALNLGTHRIIPEHALGHNRSQGMAPSVFERMRQETASDMAA